MATAGALAVAVEVGVGALYATVAEAITAKKMKDCALAASFDFVIQCSLFAVTSVFIPSGQTTLQQVSYYSVAGSCVSQMITNCDINCPLVPISNHTFVKQ